jgi:hypothetical protein
MKQATLKNWNKNLASNGFTPLTEEEWDKMISDLMIDAKEKEEYEKWNMNEIVNGRG